MFRAQGSPPSRQNLSGETLRQSVLPTSGKFGQPVTILDTDLTSPTSVSFGDLRAPFKVISPTEIETRVSDDADTGFVTVTTPTGTLKSNVKFRVKDD